MPARRADDLLHLLLLQVKVLDKLTDLSYCADCFLLFLFKFFFLSPNPVLDISFLPLEGAGGNLPLLQLVLEVLSLLLLFVLQGVFQLVQET